MCSYVYVHAYICVRVYTCMHHHLVWPWHLPASLDLFGSAAGGSRTGAANAGAGDGAPTDDEQRRLDRLAKVIIHLMTCMPALFSGDSHACNSHWLVCMQAGTSGWNWRHPADLCGPCMLLPMIAHVIAFAQRLEGSGSAWQEGKSLCTVSCLKDAVQGQNFQAQKLWAVTNFSNLSKWLRARFQTRRSHT